MIRASQEAQCGEVRFSGRAFPFGTRLGQSPHSSGPYPGWVVPLTWVAFPKMPLSQNTHRPTDSDSLGMGLGKQHLPSKSRLLGDLDAQT